MNGTVADLQLRFDFVTEKDRAVVALGCTNLNLTNVLLDGKLPPFFLGTSDEGLTIQVDGKGTHQCLSS